MHTNLPVHSCACIGANNVQFRVDLLVGIYINLKYINTIAI